MPSRKSVNNYYHYNIRISFCHSPQRLLNDFSKKCAAYRLSLPYAARVINDRS